MTKEKRCPRCGEVKPLDEFHRNRANKDGRMGICKLCNLKRVRKYQDTEGGRRLKRLNDRKYRRSARGKSKTREYVESGGYAAAHRRYSERHPERVRAKQAVARAIESGRLIRPEQCSRLSHECHGPIVAHHQDYSKPLEVIWLCDLHHRMEHGMLEDL